MLITVTLQSGLSRSFKVKVQKEEVRTKKISVKTKKLILRVKQKESINAVITPITSQDKVTYSSSDTKIASVSKKGFITARKKGKTTITVASGTKTVKIKVTVK